MTNHLGNKISRIIRDIAYTKGELATQKQIADKAHEQLRQAAEQFKAARAVIRKAEQRMSELRESLAENIDLPVGDIRAIRSWPKLPTTSYAKVMKELVRYLQAAGEPKSSEEVFDHLSTMFGMPVSTYKERVYTKCSIRKRLRLLVTKGVVARFPEENVLDGQSTAYWHWIGPTGAARASLE